MLAPTMGNMLYYLYLNQISNYFFFLNFSWKTSFNIGEVRWCSINPLISQKWSKLLNQPETSLILFSGATPKILAIWFKILLHLKVRVYPSPTDNSWSARTYILIRLIMRKWAPVLVSPFSIFASGWLSKLWNHGVNHLLQTGWLKFYSKVIK